MADVTSLVLAVDSRQVRTASADLDKFGRAGKASESAAATLRNSIRGLGGAFGAIGSGFVVRELIRQADLYSTLNARLRLVTGSTNDFQAAQVALFNIAQNTRTGLEQTTDLFGSLARSTEALGVSQSEVLGVVETINQAITVSGVSAQSAAAALVQLGQGFASGTLRGEELNSVLEQTPRLARAIADGLGVSVGQLRKLGQEGKLTAEQVFGALQKSGAAVRSEFARIPLTVGQAGTQAQNALLKLIGTIDETSGASKALADTVSDVAGFIAELADEIKKVSQGADSASILANAFVTVSETLRILAANVSFVFEGIGRDIGAVAAQIVALANLDIQGFNAISEAVKADAAKARAELDALEARILRRAPPPAEQFSDARFEANRRPTPKATSGGGKGSKKDPFGDEAKSLREQIALVGQLTQLDQINAQIRLGNFGKLSQAQSKELRALAAELDMRKDIQAQIEAQLGIDIAKIQRDLQGVVSAFGNAEAILEAQKSAGLISDQQYYDKKIGFIREQEAAQIKALEAENKRLSAERANAADRIRNQEQIKDNLAEIARIQAQAGAQTVILSLQQSAAARNATKSIDDQRRALEEYLDTVTRAQRIELESAGLGRNERDRRKGRAQIEDDFQSRRDDLNRARRDAEFNNGPFDAEQQRAYDEQLRQINQFQAEALSRFDDYYRQLGEKQADWAVGANEAFANYLADARDVASQVDQVFTSAFQGMEDALVQFITTGKLDFKSFANSLVADITRIIVKQMLANALMQVMGSFLGPSSSPIGFASVAGISGGRAIGGPVSAGGIYPVNERDEPEVLSSGGRDYLLMGGKGGEVTPVKESNTRPVIVNINQTFTGNPSRSTVEQAANAAGRRVQQSLARAGA
jgi:lambda family phage tail tape measure protein